MGQFKNPEEKSKNKLNEIFSSGTADNICDALIAMAFYEEDWKWSQDHCLYFLDHNNSDVRGVAATCLGHIARIHNCLEREKVETILRDHLKDEEISGQVQEALDGIDFFLKN